MSIDKLLHEVDYTTLAQAQNFFKVAPGIDDDIIKLDILAARKKVIGEVGGLRDTFYDDNPMFQAAVLLGAYTLYNNRDQESTAAVFDNPQYHYYIEALKDDYRYIVSLDDYDYDADGTAREKQREPEQDNTDLGGDTNGQIS